MEAIQREIWEPGCQIYSDVFDVEEFVGVQFNSVYPSFHPLPIPSYRCRVALGLVSTSSGRWVREQIK